jgi:isovaleryl-CoA dehydrogenase
LDFALGETAGLMRQTVRAFAMDHIAPRAEAIDRENTFPRDLWPRFGELGLFGVTVPENYGGAGMGYVEQAIAVEEISRASASVGLSYGVHATLCINHLHRFGTEEQKRRYLPRLLSGEWVGALAMSEPGAGSDVLSMTTRAELRGGRYVLNGAKMWITNGPVADFLIVYAKTGEPSERRGITAFLIEKTFKGFSTAQKLDKLGMRGSDTGEILFKDCEVPEANVLGGVDRGLAILMSGLDYERVVLSAGPVGIMQACLDLVLPYVRERRQFGRPIGEFELMQGKLADMDTVLNASRAYVYAMARTCDLGTVTRKDAAGVILFTAEHATQMALQAIQALGGMGYVNEMPAGRLLRDAKLYEIGAGTSEIRRMLIGRELFEGRE